MKSHVFGPVPSRRLGRSLGIDLIPFKTCTYDCIYCQLGRTTCKTVERRRWVNQDAVLHELETRLTRKPDYITLGGSGEPTLQAELGGLIAEIKSRTDVPVAVLTNGSMLWQKQLRQELSQADLVIPSLDAGGEEMFHAVNRPHENISFRQMLDGLVAFRQEFAGQYWLEIMLIAGYTAAIPQIHQLAACVNRVAPDRVQLNTVTRPPTEPDAVGVDRKRLEYLSSLFGSAAEVISDFHGVHAEAEFAGTRHEVLALLQRRPCSVEDIAHGLGLHRNEVAKHLEALCAEAVVETTTQGDKRYFRSSSPPGTSQREHD
jgi:wyosine [tRNA(Phe)-imidazoG37] synthetase (radical SAM superfamily)